MNENIMHESPFPLSEQTKNTFNKISDSPQSKPPLATPKKAPLFASEQSKAHPTTSMANSLFDNDQSEKPDTIEYHLFMPDTETSGNTTTTISIQQSPASKQPCYLQSDQHINTDTKEQVTSNFQLKMKTETFPVKRSNSLPTFQRKTSSDKTTSDPIISPKKSLSKTPTASPRNDRSSKSSSHTISTIHSCRSISSPSSSPRDASSIIPPSSSPRTPDYLESFKCRIERRAANALLNLPEKFNNFLNKSYGELVDFCYKELTSTASNKPQSIDEAKATYILAIVQILDLSELTIEQYTNAQCKALMLLAQKKYNYKTNKTYQIATITRSSLNYKLCLDINNKKHEILLGINKSDLSKTNLTNINLENTYFANSNFNNSKLTNAKCHGITMDDSTLVKLYSHGANFSNGSFERTNFESANLTLADFTDANLTGADFSNTTLKYTKFHRANLTGVNFDGADFTGANFTGAIFRHDQEINLFKFFERITKFNANEIYPETARVVAQVICPRLESTIQTIDDEYTDLKESLLDQLSLINQLFSDKLSGL